MTHLLADQLSIIWEGTNITAQAMGADGPPASTRALITAILDHHAPLPSHHRTGR